MQEQIGVWFDDHRYVLIQRFKEVVAEAPRFSGFSALTSRQLNQVVQREVDGVISFMKSDDESLEQATAVHKDQIRRFLANISIQEQLEFLQARVEILNEMFMSDPETQEMRGEFRRKLEMGKRFYRTQSRAIDMEQRFSRLAGSAS